MDASRGQVNRLHDGSKCVVEYDEFDQLLNSEVGCCDGTVVKMKNSYHLK